MEKIILNVVKDLKEKKVWCAYGYDESGYYLLVKPSSENEVISFMKSNYVNLKPVVYSRNCGPSRNLVKIVISER